MKKVLIISILTMLSACAVHTPSGSIIVDPDRTHGRGDFCPPGQAHAKSQELLRMSLLEKLIGMAALLI